MFSLHIN